MSERIDWGASKYPETAILKEVGDTIEGIVREVGSVPLSDRAASYLHIGTKDGIKTFWLGKVLTEACAKEDVKKGDYIGIKYLGEKPSKQQSPYKDYDLRVIYMEKEIDTGGMEGF